MNEAALIQAVAALVACKDLGDVTIGVARFAQRLLGAPDVLVLLRGSEGEFLGKSSDTSGELERWASELLTEQPDGVGPGVQRDGERRAVFIQLPEPQLRGVLAVTLPADGEPASDGAAPGLTEDDASANLGALAELVASCAAQLARCTQADRMLQDTRALVARGLHDLCTPLNSLRLGMHLLEPALTTKDPAVAQRAHRAVDRMAALVTGMAEALGPKN